MLQSQGDVVGGDGEEALQLWVCIQVGSVGLQEGPQGATAHVLHDEDVRLCMMRGRTGIYSVGSLLLPVEKNNGNTVSSLQRVAVCVGRCLTLSGVPVQ